MGKNLFVTGGTGRLGQRFIQLALEKGYKITALVRDVQKAHDVFQELNVELVQGDITTVSQDVLRDAMRGKDVVHIAAIVDFRASYDSLKAANVEGTRRVVQAASAEHVGRFIHMSSTGIYHHPKALPITEEQAPTPMAGYGRTKLEAEQAVQASDLDFVMIRAPAIYGPGFDEGFSMVVDWVKKGKMPIIGNGKNRVPLIHVDDVAQALMLALERKDVHRDAFIVTSGEELTQEQAYAIVAKKLHVPAPSKKVPVWLAYGLVLLDWLKGLAGKKRKLFKLYVDFLAEDRVFDISKARQKLGFTPQMTLEKGLDGLV
ncbi:NAD-dependent epimerase/dehydratase family protein [Candidatus Micrarchaeota archaeon]|nr:NAD-dependent epimerase/dehydratase family protein [Candidatus Micrarchaeota archaeon]